MRFPEQNYRRSSSTQMSVQGRNIRQGQRWGTMKRLLCMCRVWRSCVASGKRIGACHRLIFDDNAGCYDTECEFEAVEEQDILLHIQNVHNNGKEVVAYDI